MKGKLALLIGAGAGYVLGTRAGRARYEQIRSSARRMWEDPRVQQKKQEATAAVKETVREQGTAAKDKLQEKMPHSGAHSAQSGTSETSGTSGTGGSTGSTGADSAAPGSTGPSWPA